MTQIISKTQPMNATHTVQDSAMDLAAFLLSELSPDMASDDMDILRDVISPGSCACVHISDGFLVVHGPISNPTQHYVYKICDKIKDSSLNI